MLCLSEKCQQIIKAPEQPAIMSHHSRNGRRFVHRRDRKTHSESSVISSALGGRAVSANVSKRNTWWKSLSLGKCRHTAASSKSNMQVTYNAKMSVFQIPFSVSSSDTAWCEDAAPIWRNTGGDTTQKQTCAHSHAAHLCHE